MRSYLCLLVLIVLGGCEELPTQQEFPVLVTLTAGNVDEMGATFRAEVLKKGRVATTAYGFIWDVTEPDLKRSSRIVLGEDLGEGVFEKRIESALTKGMKYYIRAFATYSESNKEHTVYGNTVTLESKGSKGNPWSIEKNEVPLQGWAASFGSSTAENGYVLFQNSELNVFDPDKNAFSMGARLPVAANSSTRFASASLEKDLYIFTGDSRNVYCLSNGTWKPVSQLPFDYNNFGTYCQGASYQGYVYILGAYQSYRYNPVTKAWQARAPAPTIGYPIGGVAGKDKAYFIAGNKDLWEYDFASDKWVLKSQYPGQLNNKIIAFSQGDKIYMGLSYYARFVSGNWIDRNMWSYDPVNNTWELQQILPVLPESSSDLFYFSLKDKLYFGYGRNTYALWMFDPLKAE